LQEKKPSQLKYRFNRISGHVQNFGRCYNSTVDEKKSGTSWNDIMNNAHAFFSSQDDGAPLCMHGDC